MRFRRKTACSVWCVAVTAIAASTGPGYGQDQSQAAPPPDRTSAYLAGMNERQRTHARLFQDAEAGPTRLLDALQSVSVSAMYFLSAKSTTRSESLTRLMCEADAVLAGVVTSAESFPTQNGTFLFTEYVVHVDQVFRQPAGSELQSGRTAHVVWLGGELVIEGQRVVASHNYYPALRPNSRYLFFARRLQETGAFYPEAPGGVLELAIGRDVGPPSREIRRIDTDAAFRALRTAACR